MAFIKVCKVKDIPKKGQMIFSLHLIEFVIVEKNGEYFCLYNKCPHMGGSLGDGKVDKHGYLTCPLHSWQFDLKTGKGPAGYSDSVPKFDLQIKNDEILINEDQLLKLGDNREYLVSELHNSKERFERAHDNFDHDYEDIGAKAKWKSKSIKAMRTLKYVPRFDDILFKAAQLSRFPLLEHEKVNTETIIGKFAKKPLKISIPFYVSHMSFGALSEEAKIALATGANQIDTAMCSGEGGRNPKEFAAAGKYIYEIGTACFTRRDEWIKEANAVEIKIGQAAKPGLGGHLPKFKITPEIAKLRGIPMDQDLISPARFEDMGNKNEMREYVEKLRRLTKGSPVGIKFAAGSVEKDLETALFCKPDFITIDGRGGGTGAAPVYVKDNFAMPIVYALARARKYLDKKKSKVDLVATGGFRTSGDITKAMAMGADAVALATSSMIAIGCQQYKTCHSDNCPVGVATQNPKLRARFNIEQSTKNFVNFYTVLKHEVVEICQALGKSDVHALNYSDIFTTDFNISTGTGIEHA